MVSRSYALFFCAAGLVFGWFAAGQPVPTNPTELPLGTPTGALLELPMETSASSGELVSNHHFTTLYRELKDLPVSRLVAKLPKSYTLSADELDVSIAVFARLAELDPEKALQELIQRPGSYQRLWLRTVIRTMARADLENTFFAIEELSPDLQQLAGSAIVELFVEEVISNEELTLRVRELNAQFHQNIARTDPQTLWYQAEQLDDRDRRINRQVDVLRKLSQLQPELALSWADDLAESGYYSISDSLFSNWARIDPKGALQWLQLNDITQLSWWEQAYEGLARRDAQLALQSAVLLDEPYSSAARSAGIRYAFEDQPDELIARFDEVSSPRFKKEILDIIANAVAKRGAQELGSWFSELAENDQRLAFDGMLESLRGLASTELESALSYVSNPTQKYNLTFSLISDAARKDPDYAERLAERFADSTDGAVYQTIGANLALEDTNAAIARAQNFEGLTRDHYLFGVIQGAQVNLLRSFGTSKFDDLLNVFDQIQSVEVREGADIAILQLLERADPARAEAFAEQHGIKVESTSDGGRSYVRSSTNSDT